MQVAWKFLFERYRKWFEYRLFVVERNTNHDTSCSSPFLSSLGSGISSTGQIKVRAPSTLSIQYSAGSCSLTSDFPTNGKGKVCRELTRYLVFLLGALSLNVQREREDTGEMTFAARRPDTQAHLFNKVGAPSVLFYRRLNLESPDIYSDLIDKFSWEEKKCCFNLFCDRFDIMWFMREMKSFSLRILIIIKIQSL